MKNISAPALKSVSIGSAMIDTIAVIDDDQIERIRLSNAERAFLLLEQGAKTDVAQLSTHCGGGAMNAAVAHSRLGLSASVVVKVGFDERAEVVRSVARRNGVDTGGILPTNFAPTGASVIISAHDRNAAVFTFRGANTTLTEVDLDDAAFAADLVYVAPLSGSSADTFPYIVRQARANNCMLVANPGLQQIKSRFQDLCENLSDVDILALNRREAEAFMQQAVSSGLVPERMRAGPSTNLGMPAGAIETASKSRSLAAQIVNFGAKAVLLTDGTRGAFLGLHGQVLHVPSVAIRATSTVGAGDACVATFAAMFASTKDYLYSMRMASVNAASVVQQIDTHSGLLTCSAIEEQMRRSHSSV